MRKWLQRFTPDHSAVDGNRWLAPFRNTLLHPRLWHINRRSAAGGIAVGLFCGLIPGPFQMLGAAILAIIFRINLPLALITTLYTNPFTIVPLYLVAFALGQATLMLFGAERAAFIPPPSYGEPGSDNLLDWIDVLGSWMFDLGAPLGIGLLMLGCSLACLGYIGMRLSWRLYLLKKLTRRKEMHKKTRQI
jgi:uncharacterized protein (DUF2062 family)